MINDKVQKFLDIYKYSVVYITISMIFINIILIIIGAKFNYYMIILAIFSPLILYISPETLCKALNGIIKKQVSSIIIHNSKKLYEGKKAVKWGLISLVVFLFEISLFIYFEIWIVYWLFFK